MAKFYIKHLTKYTYSNKVIDAANLIRLHPINDEYQKVLSHTIAVTNNAYIQVFTDFYNNAFGTFMITEPHDELSIISEVEVVTFDKIFPDDSVAIDEQWTEIKSIQKQIDYMDFMLYNKAFGYNEEVLNIINTIDTKTHSPYRVVLQLCEYVYKNFKYIQGITTVSSTPEEVWDLKAGVCQDFTNVLLQLVRMTGIPARYVSGYICPNETITRGEGATHAWIEAYIPFYGWFGVDPTNNAIANENHVRLAVGRNYDDCAPVKGVFKGNVESELLVKVEVSTTKNSHLDHAFTKDFVPSSTTNSYLQNLEIIQHQQQQQQQ
ncbi:transglutaminase family protein [Confluentibacter lentus]|uniref:transglutaminase family protein n=1 Tax=Confluentibacter lentus TaxID=1699412 RepID=UPI000C29222C|nr:transglutaminase family protein [Confluentibacter lentus]